MNSELSSSKRRGTQVRGGTFPSNSIRPQSKLRVILEFTHNQSGFSLAELLVTIAITGVLFAVIGTVMFQMTTVSGSGNDSLTIWHELQNSSNQLETDCQEALTASGGSSLTLTYPTGGTVTYALNGSKLQRTSASGVNILAQNISSLSFTVTGRLVAMNITSSLSGRTNSSEQITSMVNLRPTGP
jgi:prepilin-type N-terminal cleavage/methylation domain-containing protein